MRKTFVVLLFLTVFVRDNLAQAVHGEVDFSEIDFSGETCVELSGSWEYYWNKLLRPEDFAEVRNQELINIPGSWHRGGKHPRLGYGTYRLKVRLSGEQGGLSLYFPIINSASRIWLNGELVRETGIVSTNKETYKAKLAGSIVPVAEKIKELEIVVQAANYTYYSSGIGSSPQLGQASAIFWRIEKLNGVENFFAGSLIAMALYQLILYFLYRRGKPYLWLSLICMGVALRSLIVHGGSFLLPNLFPTVEFETWKKIEFGSVYSVLALFPLYIYHLFIESAPRRPLVFFISLSSVLCIAVIATPQYTYGGLLEICHIALLLSFIYAFYSILKAWRAGSKDAKIILFGVLTAFPFILLEILKNSVLFPINIEFMYLVELGLLVFLLFQVYLLANQQAHAYKSLEVLNQNLEKIVGERTTELVTANKVKDRLLSVMSHDLKSPLNSLHGILNVYNKGSIDKKEFDRFAQQIEGDLNTTNMLVENVLYWTASQLKGVETKTERFDLTRIINDNIQLFQTIAGRKGIVISHNSPTTLFISWDMNIVNLVLRNLLANAIKFSHDGGSINVMVIHKDRVLNIQVKDHGVGMNKEIMNTILSPGRASSTSGTDNEKGTGLGIPLCRDYLLKAGASLTVESKEGVGSTFIITIPL